MQPECWKEILFDPFIFPSTKCQQCQSKSSLRCPCGTSYCSQDCQRKNAQKHKIICTSKIGHYNDFFPKASSYYDFVIKSEFKDHELDGWIDSMRRDGLRWNKENFSKESFEKLTGCNIARVLFFSLALSLKPVCCSLFFFRFSLYKLNFLGFERNRSDGRVVHLLA